MILEFDCFPIFQHICMHYHGSTRGKFPVDNKNKVVKKSNKKVQNIELVQELIGFQSNKNN